MLLAERVPIPLATGLQLLPLIPSGVEVLFMPDGKAQAILHVLGRMSKLPTIVAKKEKKAYMLEPVLKGDRTSAIERSPLSDREEAFFLSADDVERMRGYS